MTRSLFQIASALAILSLGVVSPGQEALNADHKADVRAFLAQYLKNDTGAEASVAIATVPLAGANHQETIAYITGQDWCGTGGCNLIIVEQRGTHMRVIGEVSIVRPPIRVLSTSSFGHPDLGVLVVGGGILRAYEAKLRFDGRRYPGNPTVRPAVKTSSPSPGRSLISADDRGLPLFPQAAGHQDLQKATKD